VANDNRRCCNFLAKIRPQIKDLAAKRAARSARSAANVARHVLRRATALQVKRIEALCAEQRDELGRINDADQCVELRRPDSH